MPKRHFWASISPQPPLLIQELLSFLLIFLGFPLLQANSLPSCTHFIVCIQVPNFPWYYTFTLIYQEKLPTFHLSNLQLNGTVYMVSLFSSFSSLLIPLLTFEKSRHITFSSHTTSAGTYTLWNLYMLGCKWGLFSNKIGSSLSHPLEFWNDSQTVSVECVNKGEGFGFSKRFYILFLYFFCLPLFA